MIQPGLLEQFYLFASSKGWAGGATKTTIAELPGAKVIVKEEGPLRYVDHYYIYPGSEQTFGQTVIWIYEGGPREGWFPAWGMQFGGRYPERVIDFLKTALLQTYEAKEFVGGRGPLEFQQGNLRYLNHLKKNEFDDFEGEEEVLEDGVQVGFHWYRGLLLIPRT